MCHSNTVAYNHIELLRIFSKNNVTTPHIFFSEMLKPGGYFVVVDFLDETYYFVNDVRFGALTTTVEEIKTTFTECGFEIEQFHTHTITSDFPEPAPCDAKTLYCVVGKKL